MIELPEAMNMAGQLRTTFSGKRITSVIAEQTPHKLAWYFGKPAEYSKLLIHKKCGEARGFGSMVEMDVEENRLLFTEGVNLRLHKEGEPRPARHQLLIEFDDRAALSASVQMYGGLGAFPAGELDNPYYFIAKEKTSPLSPDFNESYFYQIISPSDAQKLSLKALLATKQRIPGLGNGVLQDILFNAKMHPKRKVNSLSEDDKKTLYQAVRSTLMAMTEKGGRDTELDLFGHPGGYQTILCKNTANQPCPICGTIIKKEAYLGGSIYFCEHCQK
jgi:formamidopyrimidine-DNA glycosylase